MPFETLFLLFIILLFQKKSTPNQKIMILALLKALQNRLCVQYHISSEKSNKKEKKVK
jgi:hypothetical protein